MPQETTPNDRAILVVLGSDRSGIVARVTAELADHGVNILDISQTILGEQFAMVMMVDTSESDREFSALAQELEEMGKSIGKTVRLNRTTGKKMAKVLAHPSKPRKPSGSIHSGRIHTSTHSKKN